MKIIYANTTTGKVSCELILCQDTSLENDVKDMIAAQVGRRPGAVRRDRAWPRSGMDATTILGTVIGRPAQLLIAAIRAC